MRKKYTAKMELWTPPSEKQSMKKLLLLDVRNEDNSLFRDHAWISYGKYVVPFKRYSLIEFTAEEKEYPSMDKNGNIVTKIRLSKIRECFSIK